MGWDSERTQQLKDGTYDQEPIQNYYDQAKKDTWRCKELIRASKNQNLIAQKLKRLKDGKWALDCDFLKEGIVRKARLRRATNYG